jgi:hypothetical protein
MEYLAKVLAKRFPGLEIIASRTERDPIQYR